MLYVNLLREYLYYFKLIFIFNNPWILNDVYSNAFNGMDPNKLNKAQYQAWKIKSTFIIELIKVKGTKLMEDNRHLNQHPV